MYDPETKTFRNSAKNDVWFFELLKKNLLVLRKDGSFWRFHNTKYIKLVTFCDKEGYWFLRTRFNGERKAISLSRLIWMAHHNKVVPEGMDVHHMDENNQNNHPRNLQPEKPENHRRNGSSYGSEEEF